MRTRLIALAGALALALAACGGADDTPEEPTADADAAGDDQDAAEGDGEDAAGDVPDGPTITVTSFNFAESEILANLYGQALETAGYPVEYQLNVGNRELLLPELQSGELDLLPEYVGAALSSGFGIDPTSDLDESMALLEEAFAETGVTVLEPTPGENRDVFVVTQAFSDENGVTSISDLADAGELTLSGPPECEDRELCYLGLTETYGLDNVAFESSAEGAVRISSLDAGDVEIITLFSTQPVIAERGFVSLEDDMAITPVQNIVPAVSDEVVEAYGQDMADLLNSISELLTTEVLIELNGQVELEARNADDVAADFLAENGLG